MIVNKLANFLGDSFVFCVNKSIKLKVCLSSRISVMVGCNNCGIFSTTTFLLLLFLLLLLLLSMFIGVVNVAVVVVVVVVVVALASRLTSLLTSVTSKERLLLISE